MYEVVVQPTASFRPVTRFGTLEIVVALVIQYRWTFLEADYVLNESVHQAAIVNVEFGVSIISLYRLYLLIAIISGLS